MAPPPLWDDPPDANERLSRNLFAGTRVRLTAPRFGDSETIAGWYEDSEFARLFDNTPAYPRTPNAISRWFDDADRPRDRFVFAIRATTGDAIIGLCDLEVTQWTHRVAWLAIGIGDRNFRGLGYGGEALSLLLRFGFNELNLHRIQLTVFGYNARAIRLYERLGFTLEGVMREALLREGARYDMRLYGLLASEWK